MEQRPRIKVNRRKSLPADIYSYIAEYLPLKDILTLSLIEKSAAKGVDYEIIWINKFRRDFAISICVDVFGVGFSGLATGGTGSSKGGYIGPPVPSISHKNLYRILRRISYGYLGRFYSFTEDIRVILKNALLYAEETNCDDLSTVALQYTLQFLRPTDPEDTTVTFVTINSFRSALSRILPPLLSNINSIKILELINTYDPHVWTKFPLLFHINQVLEYSYRNIDIFDWYVNHGLNYLDDKLAITSQDQIYQMNDALLYFIKHGDFGMRKHTKMMDFFPFMKGGLCTMFSMERLLKLYIARNKIINKEKYRWDKLSIKVFDGNFVTTCKHSSSLHIYEDYANGEKRHNTFYYLPIRNETFRPADINKLITLNLKPVDHDITTEDLRRIHIEAAILWSIMNF